MTTKDEGDDLLAPLCVFLAVACGYDYRWKKIPNFLIALMAATGVAWRWLQEGIAGAFSYTGEALLIIGLLYFLFKMAAIGAGDVKLFGVTAGYLPFSKIFLFLFISLLIAAVISLLKMLKNGNFTERIAHFFAYLKDVAQNGSWKRYPENGRGKAAVGICLSGPAFVGVLLYLGGIY